MSKRIVDRADFKVDSNKEELLALLDQIAEVVLTDWGLTAERYAKDKCPVDTGRLRNSITWALGVKGAAISEYSGSDTHGSNVSTVKRESLASQHQKKYIIADVLLLRR